MELRKLSQQRDQSALAERVGDRGVEGKGGEVLGENVDPLLGHPGRNQIALVDDDNQMLVGSVLLDVVFNVLRASAGNVSRYT